MLPCLAGGSIGRRSRAPAALIPRGRGVVHAAAGSACGRRASWLGVLLVRLLLLLLLPAAVAAAGAAAAPAQQCCSSERACCAAGRPPVLIIGDPALWPAQPHRRPFLASSSPGAIQQRASPRRHSVGVSPPRRRHTSAAGCARPLPPIIARPQLVSPPPNPTPSQRRLHRAAAQQQLNGPFPPGLGRPTGALPVRAPDTT